MWGYEDYVAEDAIVGEDVGLFAILDGHGGAEVSEYCCNYLPQVRVTLARSLEKSTRSKVATCSKCSSLSAKESTNKYRPSVPQKRAVPAAWSWCAKCKESDGATSQTWETLARSSARTKASPSESPLIIRSATPARKIAFGK